MPEFRYALGRIPESVSFIACELAEFDSDYAATTAVEYRDDRKLQKLVDRRVENVLTAMVEVCGTIVAQEGVVVESYAQAVSRCGELLGLDDAERLRLEKLAIQRNRLAHRYLDLRWHAVELFRRERALVRRLLDLVLAREEQRRSGGEGPGRGA